MTVTINLNLPSLVLPNVKQKIAIWSAKGGVGKTTIAVNLALLLSERKDTLLLDADITCPNVYDMLSLEKKLFTKDGKIIPATYNNLKVISMQGISSNSIMWRGPLISQAIEELLTKTKLSEYLVIDMPPGTSDAAITIAQQIKPKLILVSTPQKESLTDLKRSVEFANNLGLEIIGLIENMSGFFGTIEQSFLDSIGIKRLVSIPLSKQIANKDFSKLKEDLSSILPLIY